MLVGRSQQRCDLLCRTREGHGERNTGFGPRRAISAIGLQAVRIGDHVAVVEGALGSGEYGVFRSHALTLARRRDG